jgi:hypothetical protein
MRTHWKLVFIKLILDQKYQCGHQATRIKFSADSAPKIELKPAAALASSQLPTLQLDVQRCCGAKT